MLGYNFAKCGGKKWRYYHALLALLILQVYAARTIYKLAIPLNFGWPTLQVWSRTRSRGRGRGRGRGYGRLPFVRTSGSILRKSCYLRKLVALDMLLQELSETGLFLAHL